ncbi:MAG: 4'-phosphopantetheinyl transferase superfamily protein [Succinatimonas sp.]|nr:4'-phosphopantetheinyl transferase superfamily protein [Succinatimonas sp.]
MLTALASMEDAFALSCELAESWHESAASFGNVRRGSFLAGRALVQHLIRVAEPDFVLPAIDFDNRGKPFFSQRVGWYFNISHSQGMIAVSVGKQEQGLDLEVVKKRPMLELLKRRILSEAELSFLKKQTSESADNLFFMLWTLRECLLKLSGRGLGGLEQVQCDLNAMTAWCPDINAGFVKSRLISEGEVGEKGRKYWFSSFVPLYEQESLFILKNGRLMSGDNILPEFCFKVQN